MSLTFKVLSPALVLIGLIAGMVVDKTLFLDYTRRQDDILDNIQEAVTWLGLRDIAAPTPLAQAMTACVAESAWTVDMLRPALAGSIKLVLGGRGARGDVKGYIHDIRVQHHKVVKAKRSLIASAHAFGLDFGHVYQILRFVEYVYRASHSAERCADLLRAMMAR